MPIPNSLTIPSPHPSPTPVTISSFSKSVILSEKLSFEQNLAGNVPWWFPNLGGPERSSSHILGSLASPDTLRLARTHRHTQAHTLCR